MEGTGFFPEGRDQSYHIEESARGAGHDLFLTGTGEVSLMAYHAERAFCWLLLTRRSGLRRSRLFVTHQLAKLLDRFLVEQPDDPDTTDVGDVVSIEHVPNP